MIEQFVPAHRAPSIFALLTKRKNLAQSDDGLSAFELANLVNGRERELSTDENNWPPYCPRPAMDAFRQDIKLGLQQQRQANFSMGLYTSRHLRL
jgi:hypothetical protein